MTTFGVNPRLMSQKAIILEPGGAPKVLNRSILKEPASSVSNGYRSANGSMALSGLVLVVDDEPLLRRMMARVLKRLGLDVVEAENGLEAIETLQRLGDRVDLILMDWNMPILSGEETIAGVRKVMPQIPVLVTSGFDAQSIELKEIPEQVQGFLQKPFRPAGLESLLRTHLVN